jgi:hypothetical protein
MAVGPADVPMPVLLFKAESEPGFSVEAAACFIHENMKRLYGDRFGKMKV